MKSALTKGPVFGSVEADSVVFQSYTGGIITSKECGISINYRVLILGYGEENGT